MGYRQIDTAEAYMNEVDVGRAVNECIKEGIITREDIFITTKLWFAFNKPGEIRKALMQSLKNLNMNYVDLFLIHNAVTWQYDEELRSKKNEEERYNCTALRGIPVKVVKGYEADVVANAWKEMEELQSEGYIRSIGVSNFTKKKLEELLKTAKVVPAANEIEFNPPMQQKTVVKYCQSKGIAIIAYSQFGRPINSDPSLNIPLKNPVIAEIAKNHNKSVAQVIIRWVIQRNILAIPKTVHVNRLKENSEIFDFELTEEEMEKMNSLNRNDRTYPRDNYCVNGDTIKDVWDYEDVDIIPN